MTNRGQVVFLWLDHSRLGAICGIWGLTPISPFLDSLELRVAGWLVATHSKS